MPQQRQVNHDSISYNGPAAIDITQWRNRVTSGDVIEAADINQLIGWINAWDNHTHTYTDYYQQATFGNNGDRTNYQESKTTAAHDEATADISQVAVGNIITAAKHNEMIGPVNKLQNAHFHAINDRTTL